jgi:hypothetical protein
MIELEKKVKLRDHFNILKDDIERNKDKRLKFTEN